MIITISSRNFWQIVEKNELIIGIYLLLLFNFIYKIVSLFNLMIASTIITIIRRWLIFGIIIIICIITCIIINATFFRIIITVSYLLLLLIKIEQFLFRSIFIWRWSFYWWLRCKFSLINWFEMKEFIFFNSLSLYAKYFFLFLYFFNYFFLSVLEKTIINLFFR